MISLLLIGLGALSGAGPEPAIDWVTGNGRLTVAIDAEGRLTQFHWPAAGRGQHLEYADNAGAGTGWYFTGAGSPARFDAAGWTITTDYAAPDSLVLLTRFKERNGLRTAEQQVFVAPDQDLLIVRLTLRSFAPDTRFFWCQRFTPFDTMVPAFPQVMPILRRMHAFGSGFDPTTEILEHFRPGDAGREDWKRLRAWVGLPSEIRGPSIPPIPDVAGKTNPVSGVSVGTISSNAILHGSVLPDCSACSTWDGKDPFPGTPRAGGPAAGLLELKPAVAENALEVTVVIGAAASRERLGTLLKTGATSDVATLLKAAADLGPAWLAEGRPLDAAAPITRPTLNLLLCTDRERGAVLRAPTDAPPLAQCAVFDSAWASAALDQRGYAELARGALAIHLESVRKSSTPDGPAGSLPRSVYSTGAAASVSGNADPESAAWLLAACWRHALAVPEEQARIWLEPIWPVLELVTDYLAREPEVGAALSGAVSASALPLDLLRTHYLGLESSRLMGSLLGKTEPGLWPDRRSELYARIRFRRLNQEGAAEPESPWIAWWIDAMPASGSVEDTAWDVLHSAGGSPLTDMAIRAAVPAEGLGDHAPRVVRDALHCLLPAVPPSN